MIPQNSQRQGFLTRQSKRQSGTHQRGGRWAVSSGRGGRTRCQVVSKAYVLLSWPARPNSGVLLPFHIQIKTLGPLLGFPTTSLPREREQVVAASPQDSTTHD